MGAVNLFFYIVVLRNIIYSTINEENLAAKCLGICY